MSNRKLSNTATRNPLKPSLLALSLLAASLSAQAANQDSAQIDDVVVTASGFQQKARNAAASISVVTQKQLENKAYRDVTDALKDVPGVVITGGASSSDISLRGMSGGYTLMLIDGKRVDSRNTRPNSDGTGIEQGWMPPIEAIQRIEVIRGPMSSLYGSDAMGGVINIITKKTTQGEWRTSIKSDVTIQEDSDSGNIYQTNIFTTGPIIPGLLGVRANALISQHDEDKIAYGYKEQKMRSGGVTFTLTPNEENTFDLDFARSIQNRDQHEGKSGTEDSLQTYTRTQYALTHTGEYEDFRTTNYIQREENDNASRHMSNRNTTFNSQTQFNLANHNLTLGGQYRDENLQDNNNRLNGNKLTRWSWSLFAEDEWRFTNQFALTTALRYEKDENFGSHWTPKAYAVWQASPQLTIKGGVSAGYKTPNLRQSAPNWGQPTGGSGGNAVILGNPNLKPEKSVSTEVGFSWDSLDGMVVGLTAFNSNFKNKITELRLCETPSVPKGQPKPAPICPHDGEYYDFISTNMNVDKAVMRGVEANFYWQFAPNWSLDSNYTFTSTKQKSGKYEGEPLNEMPKHMFNATVDWAAHDQLDVWSRINVRGKATRSQSRGKMTETGIPSYTFVDIGVNYKPTKKLNIVAGVYNIFDKDITYDAYRTVLNGRRYNIGATYKF